MCGRYSQTKPVEAMRQAFAVDDGLDLVPRWNIAPGQVVLVVRTEDGARRLAMVRWGLVPRWAEKSPSGPINARAETVAMHRLFREAFAARRCLVLAEGFYEGHAGMKPKQPWHCHGRWRTDGVRRHLGALGR
jgi:putative SOS response-associated peptidase YedK